MNIRILDTSLRDVFVVDDYDSLIWTDRYNSYGDFEIYSCVNDNALEYFQNDYYLINAASEHAMVIERIKMENDIEDGSHITVSGRSLESMLDRRIVWGLQTVSGNLQTAIKKLIDDAIINPSDTNRRVSNFVFEMSTDPDITAMAIDAQYTGDNLYDIISSTCYERGLGFKITIQNGQFVFKLYKGTNRASDVIFSPRFDNIINSSYYESKDELRNVALIGGEEREDPVTENKYRVYTSIDVDEQTGLNRREVFIDARDIQSEEDGQTISDAEYLNLLAQRGNEKIAEYSEQISFDGKAETTLMYKYGTDFFIGDIVRIENEYGITDNVRISEFIMSDNEEGYATYPVFEG